MDTATADIWDTAADTWDTVADTAAAGTAMADMAKSWKRNMVEALEVGYGRLHASANLFGFGFWIFGF